MGASLSHVLDTCTNVWDQTCVEDRIGSVEGIAGQNLHIKLRVDASPIRESMGTLMHNLKITDEFVIEAIELHPSLEILSWRHEAVRTDNRVWPGGPRCEVGMRYVRAKVNGQWVIMGVPAAPDFRSMERALQEIDDAKALASYAHSFNAHLMKTSGQSEMSDEYEGPRMRVCVPVGCRVLCSAVPQFAHPGAVVTLIPYPATEITKFVFNGQEDFSELPQAFFHYMVWMSGGRESGFDLQGVETEDGDFLLIDPVMVRAPSVGITEIGKTIIEGQNPEGVGPSQESFDALHPRCGPTCKTFDPHRRGVKARKMCGLDVPGCGLGSSSR